MNKVFLICATLAGFSASSLAVPSAVNSCERDKKSAECKAYITGLVEGYVSSKQNYLPLEPDFGSDYLARAMKNRVSESRYSKSRFNPACINQNVKKSDIIDYLADADSDIPLVESLGKYLQQRYPCKN